MEQIEEYHTDFDAHPLVQAAAKRKAELSHLKQARDKEYAIHSEIIRSYFLRMSSPNKKKYLLKMLDCVHYLETELLIMNYMSRTSKGHAVVDPNTNFIYDKDIFLDHNRMLDPDALKQTIENDLEWFTTISPRKQVHLIIDLLRRAGGNVRKSLYVPLLRKYNETLRGIKLDPAIYNAPFTKAVIKNTVNPDYENYNPYHPASIEVEKQRKKWDAMISKYRLEVEKEEKRLTNQPEELTSANSKRSGKSTKTDKSDKSPKSSKSEKGKGKGKPEDELDWLQLLPIWIVKKVFGYLDQKTLNNLKKVNDYHAYVVQELLKEMKMRKKLDIAVVKLQAEIDPVKLEEAKKTERRFEDAFYKLPKQINKEEIGVINAKLVPKKKEMFAETSLITRHAMETGDYLPNEVLTFPRVIKEDMLLYRYQPCFLKDVNLALGARGSEEKRSFVTYSLDSRTTNSSAITVDETTLQDW